MALFKKKEAQAPKHSQVAERSLSEIVHERIMTAEGWRRKIVGKSSPTAKKPAPVKQD